MGAVRGVRHADGETPKEEALGDVDVHRESRARVYTSEGDIGLPFCLNLRLESGIENSGGSVKHSRRGHPRGVQRRERYPLKMGVQDGFPRRSHEVLCADHDGAQRSTFNIQPL